MYQSIEHLKYGSVKLTLGNSMHALLDTFVKLLEHKHARKHSGKMKIRELMRGNISAMMNARLDQRTGEITVQYRFNGTHFYRTV